MNLKNTYSEIDDFFNRISFNESDINLLIIKLSSQYSSQELIKVKNIFNLKLLGYSLKKEEKKLAKNEDNIKKPIASFRIKNKHNKKERKKGHSLIELKTQDQNSFDVVSISENLQWKISIVQNIIKKRTGIKTAMKISLKEYNLCKEIFDSRQKSLQRQERINSYTKSSAKNKASNISKKSAGVWDRIAKYGPGKIIYIRSR